MNSKNLKSHSCGRSNVWLTLGLLFVAAPLAAATARVYVANRGGTTIVQVTHSEENARYGTRILELHDGWMTRDESLPARATEVSTQ